MAESLRLPHHRQTEVDGSVGRVEVRLGVGSPESYQAQVRDCPSASGGEAARWVGQQVRRVPRRSDAQPKAEFPARVVAAAQVAAPAGAACCLASPRAHSPA